MFRNFYAPDRLRRMRLPLLAYQKSGLQAVVRGLGLLKLLPKKMQAMEALLPRLGPREAVAEVTPPPARSAAVSVCCWAACSANFFSQVNAATARVLAAEGCEVVAPEAQPCCGALLVHAGEEAAAVELAKGRSTRSNAQTSRRSFTNAAGCGSNVKSTATCCATIPITQSEPESSRQSARISAKYWPGLEPRATRHRLKLRVAFHDSCHLQHAQGVRSQPRALLSSIPGLELAEIPEAAICCGSAGIFNSCSPMPPMSLGIARQD